MNRAWLTALVLAAASACSSSSSTSAPGPAANTCPDGFEADPSGDGCIDVTPGMDCPPGTRAALGNRACQAIAAIACPSGFQADPSGWGCRDISPSDICAGATFELLGNPVCQPIGDCAAAFPPPEATYFVDVTYGAGQVNATHFTTINAAVTAAPPSSVIAVEAGTYTESLDLKKPLRIVGRCAEKVILQSDGGMPAGVQALSTTGVSVKGFTLSGHRGGVVERDGDVSLEECLLTANRGSGIVIIGGAVHVKHSRIVGTVQDGELGFGVFVQSGGQLDLTSTAIVTSVISGVAVVNPGSLATITSSIVRATMVESGGAKDGKAGTGISVAEGGAVAVVTSAIFDNRTANLEVYDKGSTAKVTGSVLRDVTPDQAKNHGVGVGIDLQGHAEVDASTITGSAEWGLVSIGAGTTLKATNTVIRAASSAGGALGQGASASGAGSLELAGVAIIGARDAGLRIQDTGSTASVSGSLVRDTVRLATSLPGDGIGVVVGFGGHLDLSDASLVKNALVGIQVGGDGPTGAGSTVNVTKTLVSGTLADDQGQYGRGVEVSAGAQLVADGLAAVSNQETGVVIGEAGTTATIRNSVIRSSGVGTSTKFGHGLVVLTDASISLSSSVVRDNAGIGLAFSSCSGRIDNVVVAKNQVGVFARGSSIQEVQSQPTDVAALDVFVTGTRFVDNVTKVSASDLPLPEILK